MACPADAVIVRVSQDHAHWRHGVPVIIARRNTRKMFDEMTRPGHADLWRVLVALSIRRLGPPTARLIASAMGSLAAIENATIEDLTAIDGVGPEIAESVVNWFAATREPGDWRGATLRACQAAGVASTRPRPVRCRRRWPAKPWWSPVHWRAIRVIPPKRRLSSAGGKAAGSVSKKTDYVVIGANAGLQGRQGRGTRHPHAERNPIRPAPSHRHHLK